MNKNPFIVVDGIDGAGKTTLVTALRNHILSKYGEVFVCREPGGTVLGESLREILKNPESNICPLPEVLMHFASRFQLVEQEILPSLNKAPIVCDRWWPSTLAYQVYGMEASATVKSLTQTLIGELNEIVYPDLVLILDVPVEIAYERFSKRGEKDRFEQMGLEFFKRAREAYLNTAKKYINFELVDCSGTMEETEEQTLEIVNRYLKEFENGKV